MSIATMAKKRASKAPKPPEPGPRRTVLTMKGTEEWAAWLAELGDFLRMPTSTVVDLALVRYAKEMNFPKEAPKR